MIDQMRKDVERLATPDGRMVGTPGHARARGYVVERVRELGLEGYRDGRFEFPYAAGEIELTNVLAVLPGSDRSLPPVLVAAHYDTCGPLPGADDNASAIAIALAMPEPLRAKQLHRSIIFAFFDAEEPPHFLTPTMGSVHFYTRQRREMIHCALVMDLVGHDVPVPGLANALFVLGMESDPALERIVSACEPETGLRTIATLNRYAGDMSDHHAFRVDRRPYLFFSCGQWEHYHMPSDTPEKLNYGKMASIAEYLVQVTDAVSKTALDGPFEGYDSTATELRLMRKHAGRLAAQLGMRLDSREDLEAVIAELIGRYGLLTER